ncbi:MAG: hypothetical protein S4CHLAM20_02850 [Chlamydiia bacterium]|nr:hypothetical protein [Chlamydiia bacterium]
MSVFDELIEELSDRLNMDIYPDTKNVVSLLIEKKVKIQIQPDNFDEWLIIGATIAELPPGKFREHILKDSLKANFLTDRHVGALSYMEKNNALMIHLKLPIGSVKIDTVISNIKALTKRAQKWQKAIDGGHASPSDELPSKEASSNKSIFGF